MASRPPTTLGNTLLSRDAPFVNTYGVWVDEFEALGLGATLDATCDGWPDDGKGGEGAGGQDTAHPAPPAPSARRCL